MFAGLHTDHKVSDMEYLIYNINGVQRRTRGTRSFLVAPASLIVPGVLNGSKGRLFYPGDEVQKVVDPWNGMPVVIYHPTKQGQPISGRHPDVFDVGRVYNTKYNGRLTAEAWIDEELLLAVDQGTAIRDRLLSGDKIEVSTGLYTENEKKSGVDQLTGQAYDYIARNYRPDHLAILPDQRGACSLNDGCGLNVNAAGSNCGIGSGGFQPGNSCGSGGGGKGKIPSFSDFAASKAITDISRQYEYAVGGSDRSLSHVAQKASEKAKTAGDHLAAATLHAAMHHKIVNDNSLKYAYDREAVSAKKKAESHYSKYTELSSKGDKSTATIAQAPKPMTQAEQLAEMQKASKILGSTHAVTTKDGKISTTTRPTRNSETLMNKEELVNWLIANSGVWSEDDRPVLNATEENKLKAMKDKLEPAKKTGCTCDGQTNNTVQTPPAITPVAKPMTPAEWLAAAPPEWTSVLNNAKDIELQERQKLANTLVANTADETARKAAYTAYVAMPLQTLRTLAAAAPTANVTKPDDATGLLPFGYQPQYHGAGGGPITPTVNAGVNKTDIIPLQEIDWKELSTSTMKS